MKRNRHGRFARVGGREKPTPLRVRARIRELIASGLPNWQAIGRAMAEDRKRGRRHERR